MIACSGLSLGIHRFFHRELGKFLYPALGRSHHRVNHSTSSLNQCHVERRRKCLLKGLAMSMCWRDSKVIAAHSPNFVAAWSSFQDAGTSVKQSACETTSTLSPSLRIGVLLNDSIGGGRDALLPSVWFHTKATFGETGASNGHRFLKVLVSL